MTNWVGEPSSEIVRLSEEQRDMLGSLIQDSEYWSKAQDFVEQVDGYALCTMTERQVEWYHQIVAGLDVEIDRKEGRLAFDVGD